MRKNKLLLIAGMMALGLFAAGCAGNDGDVKEIEKQEAENDANGSQKKETLKSFNAETLDGLDYTQEDLAKKDVTVFHFWALTCAPCIREMPDIAEFAKSLPENVQLITVCLDGGYDQEGAKSVLKEAGYEGLTLLSGDGDFQKLCYEIQYTPTTIVVDKDGNMIGEEIIGAQENLTRVYTDAINEALSSMGKAEL